MVITCRTQLNDEELPKEIEKRIPGPVGGLGSAKFYHFHKYYLSPFDDPQVKKFLEHKLPNAEEDRKKAHELVTRIPELANRPLILTYIKDLVQEKKSDLRYTCQLYDVIVRAWLKRERKIGASKLLGFSKDLAICLLTKELDDPVRRQDAGLTLREIGKLGGNHNLELNQIKITDLSLLCRDSIRRFNFAHRSIMEYLYACRWLELEPEERPHVFWKGQLKSFMKELLSLEYEKSVDVAACIEAVGKPEFTAHLESFLANDNRFIITAKGNPPEIEDEGFDGFDFISCDNEDMVVLDSTTGLMWQCHSSAKMLGFDSALKCVEDQNKNKFGGYDDWQLPSTVQLLTLKESERNKKGYHVHPLFNHKHSSVWTSEFYNKDRVWTVDFRSGYTFPSRTDFKDSCVWMVRQLKGKKRK